MQVDIIAEFVSRRKISEVYETLEKILIGAGHMNSLVCIRIPDETKIMCNVKNIELVNKYKNINGIILDKLIFNENLYITDFTRFGYWKREPLNLKKEVYKYCSIEMKERIKSVYWCIKKICDVHLLPFSKDIVNEILYWV